MCQLPDVHINMDTQLVARGNKTEHHKKEENSCQKECSAMDIHNM